MKRPGCCIKQMAETKPKSSASGKWARLEWGTQLQFLHSKRFTSAIAGNKKLCVIARDAQTYNLTCRTTRLPDIVVLDKESRVCKIIDVVCPFDTQIAEKEREKVDHYQDLKVQIQKKKMWSCKSVSVIPVVIGALGAVTKNLMMWVTKIGTPGILNLLQEACLLGTAKILRRILDI